MFHFYVSFVCNLSIAVCSHRLSRAIHEHIFSGLANAQFAHCISCLTLQVFLFWIQQIIAFLPFHTCLSFIMFEYVSFLCSIFCNLSIPVFFRTLSRAIHLHNFCRLACAQFADCMACLTLQTFLFWFQQTVVFSLVYSSSQSSRTLHTIGPPILGNRSHFCLASYLHLQHQEHL